MSTSKATPRTDEAAYYHGLGGTVGVNFARQLETELAAATKRIDDCEFLLAHRYKIIERQEPRIKEAVARAEKAEAEITASRERVRVLRSALERRHDEQSYHCQYVDDALAATKEDSQ